MLSLITSTLLAFSLPTSADGVSPTTHRLVLDPTRTAVELHVRATSDVSTPQGGDRVDPNGGGSGGGGGGGGGGGFIGGGDRVDPRRSGGPVPEPATILLVGSGVLGAAYCARRARRHAGGKITAP